MKHSLALLLLLVSSQSFGQTTVNQRPKKQAPPPQLVSTRIQTPLAAVQAPLVSNRLPLEFVRMLNQKNLAIEGIDDPNHPAGRSLINFIDQLKRADATDKAVDSLFGFTQDELPEVRPLYEIKLELMRFLLSQPTESSRMGIASKQLITVETKWKKQYLRSVVALIRVLKIQRFEAILDQFTQALESNSLELIDLSPANRIKLDTELGSTHGVRITDQTNNVFVVKGLYSDDKKQFAVDLSQNFEDSIVTLAHEIVHAADPELQVYRAEAKSLLPEVKLAFQKVSPIEGDDFVSDLLSQVLFELGREEIFKIISDSRRHLQESLEKNTREVTARLTDADKSTVRRWIRAILGSTIENEYKAYGLSIVVYRKLQNVLEILPPSANMDYFVQRILAGDAMFVNDLSVRMNPFQNRYDKYRGFLQKHNLTNERKVQVDQISNFIQATYLEQLQKFIESLNNEFSEMIKTASPLKATSRPPSASSTGRTKTETRSTYETPDCVKPGMSNSPVCPYSIIGARISTLQIVKFRENLNLMLTNLRSTAATLYTLRAGILDLSDLNMGDLKFLGVFFDQTTADQVRISYDIYGRTNNFIKDISDLPSLVRIHSKITPFDLNLTRSDNMIAGDLLIQELLKLRILRGITWLDDVFPNLRLDILGMKMTIEKLRTRLYSTTELTKERALELENELVENLETATLTPTEISKITALFDILSEMHSTSVDFEWKEIANALQTKATSAKSSLEKLGFKDQFVMKDFKADLFETLKSFRAQIEKDVKSCRPIGPAVPLYLEGPYQIKTEKFPLTAVCYRGQLHLIRQPLDTKTSVSLMVRSERLAVRLFSTGRMIQILPFEYLGGYK